MVNELYPKKDVFKKNHDFKQKKKYANRRLLPDHAHPFSKIRLYTFPICYLQIRYLSIF